MSCAEFTDVAAELALGVLTGRERAEALAHLDHCEACREHVRQLTMTGEQLITLLPAREPPAGFETRVMERIGLAAPGRARAAPGRIGPISRLSRAISQLGHRVSQPGRPRRLLAAAAAAVAVIVAGLGGWGLRAATSSPPASPLSSATLLTASHQTAGTIYFYDSGSRWLYMSVNIGPGSGVTGNGTVLCQVEGPDGHVTTIGSFRLTGGYGYWGSPDPATNGPLTGARLVTTTGAILATATFPT
jgi:anti-sigma-K factor RskA